MSKGDENIGEVPNRRVSRMIGVGRVNLSGYSIAELIEIYSQTIKELKKRGVLRTKNVVGEIGEYLVLEHYEKSENLPNLNIVPVGTKNINAVSQNGERYSIKTTTGNVTGVIYGLQPRGSSLPDKQMFEYVVICKLDDDCELQGIYQLSWESFQKHKKWHSRMNAWNISVTKAMKEDSYIVYEKENFEDSSDLAASKVSAANFTEQQNAADVVSNVAVKWNKTEVVNHKVVRDAVAKRLQKKLNCNFNRESQSRYVSSDKELALFILSASYSQKNGEYWYSMNDENIPWLELFPQCYIAFALGGDKQVLLFSLNKFKELLQGCLRTKNDPSIKKKAHYHFSFSVDGSKVYFKKKLPKRDFIEVSDCLL